MRIQYATATGLYSEEDFNGPPPMPYAKVYDAAEVDALIASLQEDRSVWIRARIKQLYDERDKLRDELAKAKESDLFWQNQQAMMEVERNALRAELAKAKENGRDAFIEAGTHLGNVINERDRLGDELATLQDQHAAFQLAVASGENPIVRQLRAEVVKLTKERNEARADERQHWTDFENKACEVIKLRAKLTEVKSAIDKSEHADDLGYVLRAKLRAILNQPPVSSEKFSEKVLDESSAT